MLEKSARRRKGKALYEVRRGKEALKEQGAGSKLEEVPQGDAGEERR